MLWSTRVVHDSFWAAYIGDSVMPADAAAPSTHTSQCSFYNDSDALFAPTTVWAEVKSPDGRVVRYPSGVSYPPAALTTPSTGVYLLKFDALISGTYIVTWYGATTAGKITAQDKIIVR